MAKQFVEDLLLDPTTRGVNDIRHVVRAVSSSSGAARAQEFINSVIGSKSALVLKSLILICVEGSSSSAVAYGSLEELVQDPDVDAVYVSSITSAHYENVQVCLAAKKAVLCEVCILFVDYCNQVLT